MPDVELNPEPVAAGGGMRRPRRARVCHVHKVTAVVSVAAAVAMSALLLPGASVAQAAPGAGADAASAQPAGGGPGTASPPASISPEPAGEPVRPAEAATAEERKESKGEDKKKEEDEEEGHDGSLSRISVGIGYGTYAGRGTARPIPGVRLIKDPSYGAFAFNAALDWGIGTIENLALHVGPAFEMLLTSDDESSIDGFYMLGVGGGASYYFLPLDLYLIGQVRWMGAFVHIPDAACGSIGIGKLKLYDGINLSLSFGKAWFAEDREGWGLGIGLQLNYAYLTEHPTFNYFSIMLVPTLTSF